MFVVKLQNNGWPMARMRRLWQVLFQFGHPRLGLLADTRRLEPVFLARFQPNLASRMLGLSFLAFGPSLHILEF